MRLTRALAVVGICLAAPSLHAAQGDPLLPILTPGDATHAVVRAVQGPGGDFIVVLRSVGPGYVSYYDVQPYDGSGQPQGPAWRAAEGVYWDSVDIRLDRTGAVLAAWQPERGIIKARRFSRGGAPLTKELQVTDQR